MPFFRSGLAVAVSLSWAQASQADVLDALIEAERHELSLDCETLELNDGFAVTVNVNGDDLDDALIDYGSIVCNGSVSMFCGSAGCVQNLYIQHAGGRFERILSSNAYGFSFDRPEQASFVGAFHGSAYDRVGVETCYLRYRWDGQKLIVAGEVPAPRGDGSGGDEAPPHDRWAYLPEARAAAIGPDDDQLSLTCEDGAVRVRYSAWWMFEDGRINDFVREWNVREWDGGVGITASFDVGGRETDIAVHLVEEERRLVARETVEPGSRLLDEIARGRRLTLHHGGSLEHQLDFALAGSGAAIRALRQDCG